MIINSNIDVKGTSFEGNKAGFGGAIRFTGLIPKFLLNIKSSDLN